MDGPARRVAVDLTSQLGPLTGVGVMARELVVRLAPRHDVALTAFAVTWRGRRGLRAVVPREVAVIDRPMAARPLHAAWRRADHPLVDRWIGAHDVVWGPNFVVPPTRAAAVVTVHDLTPVRYPALADEATLAFPAMIRRALGRGAWVHTPSEFVRAEVIDEFRADPDRVVAIHHGVGSTAAGAGDPARGRARAGGDRFVLAVGTVEPRKDLPSLVAAFDALAGDDADVRLVLAGADGWGAGALADAVAAARHRDRVVRLGRVDEATRLDLLAAAAVYAYPSVYEGFGLPPVEAMAAGVPVVAGRAGAVPEVCRDAADLVEPGDVDGLAAALLRALDDPAHRAARVARGRDVAATYDWDRAAGGLAALLHRAAAAR